MVEKHVSLPKAFSGGDWNEWLLRFDICAEANGWKNDVRVVKLPTLLEGEALAVFTEIGENERKDYHKVTDALKGAFHPTESQFSPGTQNNLKKGNCFRESHLVCSCTV